MRIQHPGDIDLLSANDECPAFRVTFWHRASEPADVPEEDRAFFEDPWDIFDANIKEVISWADSRVEVGLTYTVHVALLEEYAGARLLWLYGENPTVKRYDREVFTRAFSDESR